jgi:hypothetical protein
VIGNGGDGVLGEPGEVRRLPVVVPAMEDRLVDAALEGGIRCRCEQVDERRPEPAKSLNRPLAVLDCAA